MAVDSIMAPPEQGYFIAWSNLKTYQSGRFFFMKTFCEPMRIASIMNPVEDESGDVDRIALYNCLINIHVLVYRTLEIMNVS